MKRRIALFALAAFLASPIAARAADPVPMPNAAETAFITGVQADLNRRFPTTAAAERAGYVRYTNEDNTGAISYANNKWVSASPRDPSQLWYDVNGRLLGADYSVLQANNPTPPSFFGVDASRFSKTPTHVHYVIKNPDGTLVYSKAVRTSKWLLRQYTHQDRCRRPSKNRRRNIGRSSSDHLFGTGHLGFHRLGAAEPG